MADQGIEKLRRLVGAENGLCTIACLRKDGSPHTSVVNAGVMDHPVTGALSVALVVRANAAKIRMMRRDPRVAITFRHSWDWMSVHGTASLIGLDDPAEGFDMADLPELLRQVFRSAGGTHDDWDEYDRVMAAQRRLAVFIAIDRLSDNSASVSL